MADITKELRERAAIRASREGPFTKENLVEWRAADALDAAHKRIAELSGGWRPIESAPKDGKHVLLCVQSGAFFYAVEGAYHGGEWLAAFRREPVQPVYWAPKPAGFVLPSPPSRIDKEDRNG